MKKLVLFLMMAALILSLAACGTTGDDTQEKDNSPATTESIISAVVNGPVLVYQENTDSLKENNGANIGTEEVARQSVEDGVEFAANEGENPFLPFAKRLDSEGMEGGDNQAVYVSFCPSGKDFGFMLSADTSFGITIGEDSEPCIFVMDNNYMVPVDTDLKIEPGNWYSIFLAVGSGGDFHGALWKNDDPDNVAYFSLVLGAFENGDQYKNTSWELQIGFQGESTLKIGKYEYYTFNYFEKETAMPEISESDADLDADPMNVVYTVLNDPNLLAGENASAMIEDMGGLFGSIDVKQPGEDGTYFQFAAENNSAWMPYNEGLADAGGEHRGNTQAILIKFQPEDVNNLSFNFEGKGEIVVCFDEENHPCFVNVQGGGKYPFSDYAPTDLALESGKWYYALFAFDTDGNFRAVIWEDGNAQGRAYCAENLSEQSDDYKDNNWTFVIGFDAGGKLNAERYDIMDFDGFSDANS